MRALAAGITTALLLLSSTALATENGTSLDELEASIGEEAVELTGSATFAGTLTQVGEDPAGDAAVPGVGGDLVRATIEPTSPDELVFTLEVADQPPVIHGLPETVGYMWTIYVADGDELLAQFRLIATRTGLMYTTLRDEDPQGPVLLVSPCDSTDASSSCSLNNATAVPGAMEDAVVQWVVPMDVIGAEPGNTISEAPRGVLSGVTLSGWFWFSGIFALDEMSVDPYTIPVPEVRAGFVPGEADPETVALPVVADLILPSGEFTATVARPQLGIDGPLLVRACFDSCAWETIEVPPRGE